MVVRLSLKKYLRIVKDGDIYKKCEIKKNLRYGRGKKCTSDEAQKIIASGASLIARIAIGKWVYETYEFEEPLLK
jgi:hypothetical protein